VQATQATHRPSGKLRRPWPRAQPSWTEGAKRW